MITFQRLNLPFLNPQAPLNTPRRNAFGGYNFSGSSLAPLSKDTVTFTGSGEADIVQNTTQPADMKCRNTKMLGSRADLGSWKVANDIINEEDMKFAYERFKTDISSIFDMEVIDFSDTEHLSENKKQYKKMLTQNIKDGSPILAITARKKDPSSLREKMGSRDIRTKKEAKKKINDIIGVRITLSGTTKDSGNYVIKKLAKAVEQGKIKVVELENYRNPEFKYPTKYQYASESKLEGLVKAAQKRGVKNFNYDIKPTESGYTAIHMLLEFPGNIKGELQISGLDVLRLKEYEDLCFKVLTDKAIPHKYKPIKDMFKEIQNNDAKYAAFMDYTRKAYAHERIREPHPLDDDPPFYALEDDMGLEDKYDFNVIAQFKDMIDESEAPSGQKNFPPHGKNAHSKN